MSRPIVNKEFKINSVKDLPCGTYGEAMLLTETMEGWRSERPVIDQSKCIHCNWCYMVCPEGAIYREDNEIKVDYRFCKGCGICQRECKKGCIDLIEEGEKADE